MNEEEFNNLTDEQKQEIIADIERQSQNNQARSDLSRLDWKVIRELERLYLAGTDLNVEREALRNKVVD